MEPTDTEAASTDALFFVNAPVLLGYCAPHINQTFGQDELLVFSDFIIALFKNILILFFAFLDIYMLFVCIRHYYKKRNTTYLGYMVKVL